MIISASRRTDIPAFFGEWFYNRLLDKNVLVRNPMNSCSITKIPLEPKYIECIVFWTKNPKNFLKYLHGIDELGYKYYFQFTLTAYSSRIERNIPSLSERVDTFINLSKIIGKEKVIWRYDPIFLNDRHDLDFHKKAFGYLCDKLYFYTEKCVISFIDNYSFIRKNLNQESISELRSSDINIIASHFSRIAKNHNIRLSTCCERIDLESYDIYHNRCIDDELIKKITLSRVNYIKDKSQRKECGCIASRDIGSYNTCKHNCIYCYARRGNSRTDNSYYNPKSPILCDNIKGHEKITILALKDISVMQPDLF